MKDIIWIMLYDNKGIWIGIPTQRTIQIYMFDRIVFTDENL